MSPFSTRGVRLGCVPPLHKVQPTIKIQKNVCRKWLSNKDVRLRVSRCIVFYNANLTHLQYLMIFSKIINHCCQEYITACNHPLVRQTLLQVLSSLCCLGENCLHHSRQFALLYVYHKIYTVSDPGLSYDKYNKFYILLIFHKKKLSYNKYFLDPIKHVCFLTDQHDGTYLHIAPQENYHKLMNPLNVRPVNHQSSILANVCGHDFKTL